MNREDLRNKLSTIDRKVAVCTLSGGLDSTVASALIADAGFSIKFIFFDWGQKTYEKEKECAIALAAYFKAALMTVEVPILKKIPGISLTQAETKTTAINEYVPNRNAVLESQTVAFAESLKAGVVCVGSTGGDHICPDNSPDFINAMQNTIDQGTMLKPSIKLVAPLLATDKVGAVKLGLELNVPFSLTWSCHNNNDMACGYCSNCQSRLEAFQLNNLVDPIPYAK